MLPIVSARSSAAAELIVRAETASAGGHCVFGSCSGVAAGAPGVSVNVGSGFPLVQSFQVPIVQTVVPQIIQQQVQVPVAVQQVPVVVQQKVRSCGFNRAGVSVRRGLFGGLRVRVR